MTTHIRPASKDDIDAIIKVHRDSVTLLCSKDYGAEQIAAWTGKHASDVGKQRWKDRLQNDFVWVLEANGEISGFAHFRFTSKIPAALYLNALYLAPTVAGQGFGQHLLAAMEQECAKRSIRCIQTHATKNALNFYERMGFKRNGEIYIVNMAGVGIESFPMEKNLHDDPTNFQNT